MGFHSTLLYYRPGKPPSLVGDAVANFVEQFVSLGLTIGDSTDVLLLKHGDAAEDDKPLTRVIATATEGIATVDDSMWDFESHRQPLLDAPRVLRDFDQVISHGHVGLGALVPHVVEQLSRIDSPENDVDFVLDSASLLIGPIETGPDGEFMVGSLAVGLGGNGYLFPWTLRDLVERAERIPEVQQMVELCQATWPVEPAVPDQRIQEARRHMREYWPYDRVDRPWAWYWGLQGLL